MNDWLTWTLARAIPISAALVLLNIDHWAAFATAGAMLQILHQHTVFNNGDAT